MKNTWPKWTMRTCKCGKKFRHYADQFDHVVTCPTCIIRKYKEQESTK